MGGALDQMGFRPKPAVDACGAGIWAKKKRQVRDRREGVMLAERGGGR